MKPLLIVCCMLMLSACATAPYSNYRAAKGDGPGYREIILDSSSYRVQFKLRGNQRTAARNYALQRAAELTLAAGYDWFIVSKQKRRMINEGNNSPELPETFSTRRCGLLGCQTQTYPSDSSDPHAREEQESYTLVLLDIHMGKGIRPENTSYDAQETWDQLADTQ